MKLSLGEPVLSGNPPEAWQTRTQAGNPLSLVGDVRPACVGLGGPPEPSPLLVFRSLIPMEVQRGQGASPRAQLGQVCWRS